MYIDSFLRTLISRSGIDGDYLTSNYETRAHESFNTIIGSVLRIDFNNVVDDDKVKYDEIRDDTENLDYEAVTQRIT